MGCSSHPSLLACKKFNLFQDNNHNPFDFPPPGILAQADSKKTCVGWNELKLSAMEKSHRWPMLPKEGWA
ncbi:hypothetical protein J4Q44_G00231830 [Coregonus suidteri]|uniref:Uncharacterized protein n=1 Tax=Coregonus suidteri TaxID=861788 RepID=A0AAN8QPZ7_9TELE